MVWEVAYIAGLVWTQWQSESWLLAGTEQWLSFDTGKLFPKSVTGRLGVPQSRCGLCEEENNLLSVP
jgi:hypothetical protein